MHIEFLVEEPSMQTFLEAVVGSRLGEETTYKVHNLRGKERLLRELPNRLRGYRNWPSEGLRIVVLVDRDEADCYALKARLEEISRTAGLRTRTHDPLDYQVVNRVVVEELEAWRLGDPDAMRCPEAPGKLWNACSLPPIDKRTDGERAR